MTEETKKLIDEMSFEEMFRKWRFTPTGDFLFRDEIGKYFVKVFNEKRELLTDEEYTTISKRLGW